MSEQLKRLKELREDHKNNSDNYNKVLNDWRDLTSKTKTKVLMKKISDNLEG